MPLIAPSPPRSALAACIDAALDPYRLPGRVGAVFADLHTGEVLYEREPTEPITPASTLKLVTALAAIHRLGPHHRLPTALLDVGDDAVALSWKGDITLSRKSKGHYPDGASLAVLARAALAARGGRPPRALVVDSSWRGTAPRAPGTVPTDLRYATAAIGPLMLDGGRLAPGHDRRRSDPGRVAIRSLARLLGADGVVEAPVPACAATLATVYSPPMATLVHRFLHDSDNTLADVVALHLAEVATGKRTWSALGRVLTGAMTKFGVDAAEVGIVDGSGLSHANWCTAKALADLLVAASWFDGSGQFGDLSVVFDALPVAGQSGTLRDRFLRAPAGIGVVRAKTGTLAGTTSLAGLITGPRPLAFAVLTSGNSDNQAARDAVDEAVAAAAMSTTS